MSNWLFPISMLTSIKFLFFPFSYYLLIIKPSCPPSLTMVYQSNTELHIYHSEFLFDCQSRSHQQVIFNHWFIHWIIEWGLSFLHPHRFTTLVGSFLSLLLLLSSSSSPTNAFFSMTNVLILRKWLLSFFQVNWTSCHPSFLYILVQIELKPWFVITTQLYQPMDGKLGIITDLFNSLVLDSSSLISLLDLQLSVHSTKLCILPYRLNRKKQLAIV